MVRPSEPPAGMVSKTPGRSAQSDFTIGVASRCAGFHSPAVRQTCSRMSRAVPADATPGTQRPRMMNSITVVASDAGRVAADRDVAVGLDRASGRPAITADFVNRSHRPDARFPSDALSGRLLARDALLRCRADEVVELFDLAGDRDAPQKPARVRTSIANETGRRQSHRCHDDRSHGRLLPLRTIWNNASAAVKPAVPSAIHDSRSGSPVGKGIVHFDSSRAYSA